MMRNIAASLLFFLLTNTAIFAQLPPVQQKAMLLKRMVELKHYAPRPVDDSFSLAVFRKVLNDVDQRRLLFTAADYQQLLAFDTRLDDEMLGNGWGFYDKFSELYRKAVMRADTIVNKLLQKPFDYSLAEVITSSRSWSGGFTFSSDVAALTNKWSRYLKYLILDDVYDAVTSTGSVPDSTKKITFKAGLFSLEPGIREKIKKTELKTLKKIIDYPDGYSTLTTEIYLTAIASCFDPHTNYFSPQGKEEFQAELSTEVIDHARSTAPHHGHVATTESRNTRLHAVHRAMSIASPCVLRRRATTARACSACAGSRCSGSHGGAMVAARACAPHSCMCSRRRSHQRARPASSAARSSSVSRWR